MDHPTIRPATDRDLDDIRRIHTASWQSAYVGLLPDDYLARVPDRHATQWARLPDGAVTSVAEVADGLPTIVGFACVHAGDGLLGDHLLDNLHVDPALRGGGVGARLLADVHAMAADATPGGRLYLWVFEHNTGGRRFYAREGGIEGRTRVEVLAPGVEVLERLVWWRL